MKKIIEKIKNDEIINLIKKYSHGIEIYLVGGAVRDFYLNKENLDKDIIVCNADAKKFAQNLAESLDAVFVSLDEEFKIYRLILNDKVNYIDIASPIGKNLEEDLRRRDLTINAIAVNLNTFEILDILDGVRDLKSKTIRPIAEQNFIDDPLRMLRVFRFQAILGFGLDPNLSKIVAKYAHQIKKSAAERISYELLKLFSGEFAAEALILMDEAQLLKEILPISQELKKVPPNLHHHLDLFFHSMEIVKQIQLLYESSNDAVKTHLEKIDFGGHTRLAHLKFAGFLHDIGKPSTWNIEEETGKHRFIKHDDVGSKMGVDILKQLKLSKKQTDYITKLIKNHIYPSHVVSAPEMTEKIYMRFIRKMDADVVDVIILAMADRLSARGVEITDDIVARNINNLKALLDYYLKIKDTMKPLPKLLSGNDIMDILNIQQSKKLGEIIISLKDAQLSGDVTTRDEAVKFIKSMAVSRL